jgi:hypothetical protein
MTGDYQRPIGADRAPEPDSEPLEPTVAATSSRPEQTLGGDEGLEIVGEASYQDALWAICGGPRIGRIRHEITAALVPDPVNDAHDDPNAISVWIDDQLVGYLPRETASRYRPGLQILEMRGGTVGLRGVIVGGGSYSDGPRTLGVWLWHDPADFGVESSGSARKVGPASRPVNVNSEMRTGFSEAWATDVDDDSYDLSWFNELPEEDGPAIAKLRELLSSDPDPIDRHFQFVELETRLYRCRERFDTALEEFDQACRLHDAEMDTICEAFQAKFGKIPVLDTYRQMAIRQQKQGDWNACIWWAERGLALYGDRAARQDAVEDLVKRRNRALSKLETK